MFSDDRLATIFGNIEEIYHFSRALLLDMERQFRRDVPQAAEFGCIFLNYVSNYPMNVHVYSFIP